MSNVKKLLLIMLFVVCVVGSLFSGAYLLVNTIENVKYFSSSSDDAVIKIKSIDRTERVAKVTTVGAHGYSTGDYVKIKGADQTGYNGSKTITKLDATSFTYEVGKNVLTPATGTTISSTWDNKLYGAKGSGVKGGRKGQERRKSSIKQSSAADKGDPNDGIYGFLQSISIDRSSITPGLLLWFFLYISICSYRSLRSSIKKTNMQGDSMRVRQIPLPGSYFTTWIQLGFIGTLWGFILIGIKMRGSISQSGEGILDILIRAFDTALLSTFVAVVLVYVSAPLVTGLWRWIHDINISEPEVEGSDIETQLRVLSDNLIKSNASMAEFNKGIEELKITMLTLSPHEIIKVLKEIAVDTKKLDGLGNLISSTKDAVIQSTSSTKAAVIQSTSTIKDKIGESDGKIEGMINIGIDTLSNNIELNNIAGVSRHDELLQGQGDISNKVVEAKCAVDENGRESSKSLGAISNHLGSMAKDIASEVKIDAGDTTNELVKVNKKLEFIGNTMPNMGRGLPYRNGVGTRIRKIFGGRNKRA